MHYDVCVYFSFYLPFFFTQIPMFSAPSVTAPSSPLHVTARMFVCLVWKKTPKKQLWTTTETVELLKLLYFEKNKRSVQSRY